MATMICLEDGLYLNMDYVFKVKFYDEETRYSVSGKIIDEFDEDTQPARVETRLIAEVETSIVIDVDEDYRQGYRRETMVKYYKGKPAETLKKHLDHYMTYELDIDE